MKNKIENFFFHFMDMIRNAEKQDKMIKNNTHIIDKIKIRSTDEDIEQINRIQKNLLNPKFQKVFENLNFTCR